MSWPTPQEYNEALQHPQTSFQDPELRGGIVELTSLGLPRPTSGAFASVYKVQCGKRDYAVRCFLHDIPNHHERYLEISEFIIKDDLIYTVDFEFIPQGILIRGLWYPILKMEWVDGSPLINYIERHLKNSKRIADLTAKFEWMVMEIKRNGIAHGDLQHGNLLIVNDDFCLVDYDGMYVPKLSGWLSNELGHRNYQHPYRRREDFGPYLDNFSIWVIHSSLRFLNIDPDLWWRTKAGDECLLFRRDDFIDPERSPVFKLLEKHPLEEIRATTLAFHKMLRTINNLAEIELLFDGTGCLDLRRPNFWDNDISAAYIVHRSTCALQFF